MFKYKVISLRREGTSLSDGVSYCHLVIRLEIVLLKSSPLVLLFIYFWNNDLYDIFATIVEEMSSYLLDKSSMVGNHKTSYDILGAGVPYLQQTNVKSPDHL